MIGSQEPRIKIEPHRASSDGQDAAIIMREYGNKLDEWQEKIVECWLGLDEEGKYNVTSAGLAVPRQNGKNVCLEAREMFGMLINGERILHTAHQVKTSKKSFRRLVAYFTDDRHPEIEKEVAEIRYTNGEECIRLKNGGSIEYSTRSRQAARGFDGISLVVYDEAQELTDEQVEATMATLAASQTGFRQIIYTGTPPYPGCPGVVFRRKRKGTLGNPGKNEAWHEWSPLGDSVDDINLDDKSLWYQSNPAMGIHLTEEFTETERKDMSPDGFARERLGWWPPEKETAEDKMIDAEKWAECASRAEKPQKGTVAYGVKFSLDSSEVALGGAIIEPDGNARISLIKFETTNRGTKWLADWLNERYEKAACVVIDGKNGADLLIDRISERWKAKDSIIRANSRNVIDAATHVTEMINDNTLTWYEPQEALNQSAINSTRRKIGGGVGFGGPNSAPIEACSLALWGAKTSKRDPSRKGRIG
ncbi:MAG: hypothetical protein KBS68_04470 [Clostridiales bacterium]|nr:hypothetical protein [Candidatus Crickella merdequi]